MGLDIGKRAASENARIKTILTRSRCKKGLKRKGWRTATERKRARERNGGKMVQRQNAKEREREVSEKRENERVSK